MKSLVRRTIQFFPSQNILQLSKLQLRLDSHLYLLSKDETDVSDPSLVLEEAYAIKGGPVVVNVVGSWRRRSGLTIPGLIPSQFCKVVLSLNP